MYFVRQTVPMWKTSVGFSHSIRIRIVAAATGIVVIAGVGLAGLTYFNLGQRLEEEVRELAIHETKELRAVVCSADPRGLSGQEGRGFPLLFPEDGVVSLELRDENGDLLESAGPDPRGATPWTAGIDATLRGEAPCETFTELGAPTRVRAALSFLNPHTGTTWIAIATVSQDSLDQALTAQLWNSLLGIGIATILAAMGSWILLTGALRSVHTMVQDAKRVAESGPSGRLVVPPAGSELRELAIFLNLMVERAGTSLDRLSRFTAYASHELRTPLTRIRGEAEIALVRGGEERLRSAVESTLEEVQAIDNLVVDLLELARGDAKSEWATETIDLVTLLLSLVEECRVGGEMKGIQVDFEHDSAPMIDGNRNLLARGIWNVLDNALQYSPEGTRISVTLEQRDGTAQIIVTDQGPGIPAEELAHVFEPFRRLGDPRRTMGLGLGLAVSLSIIQRHGGSISVEGCPTNGTRACITLPTPRPVESGKLSAVNRGSGA